MSLQLESSPPSSPAGLLDPFASPYDFLTLLCDVVPGISIDPIRSRATADGVLAPINRTDTVVATSPASFVLAAAKAQGVGAVPSVDAVSSIEAVDNIIIRGACKGVGSIVALDKSRREARVVVLGNPIYGEELPSCVQPGSIHVQRPHQAVLARIPRAPVRVESSAKRVGGYALSGFALVFGVEVLFAPPAVPAGVANLVGDFPEVPADHKLSVHHLNHLHRA